MTTPDTATAAEPKPVMVWLHSGAFIAGFGSLYDPHRMAMAGDVVVVTLNYRLGVFGFLSFPGLAGSGTFGLQDQQAALRWVQANIAVFGGDPDNVTLVGESAGGMSVCAHLASPAAAGLFHRAIIQSGPCDMSWPANGLFPGFPAGSAFGPRAERTPVGAALGALIGYNGQAAGIACLRAVGADDLRQNQLGYVFTPAYDTPLLPRAPAEALAAEAFTPVPVIIGPAFSDAHAIAARYAELARQSPALAWTTLMTDRVFACPTLKSAGWLAAGATVFAYEFADPAPPMPAAFAGVPAGAYHASEVPYLLDMIGEPIQLDPAQRQLAAAMIDYWTAFAHTGDPNQQGRPAWAPYDPTAAEPVVLSLQPGPDRIAPGDYATAHYCDFWAALEATD